MMAIIEHMIQSGDTDRGADRRDEKKRV